MNRPCFHSAFNVVPNPCVAGKSVVPRLSHQTRRRNKLAEQFQLISHEFRLQKKIAKHFALLAHKASIGRRCLPEVGICFMPVSGGLSDVTQSVHLLLIESGLRCSLHL